jgi:hypothetical protein
MDSSDFRLSSSCSDERGRVSTAPSGGAMFGRVIFFATACVALALLGSSFLLNRLPEPALASVAGATGASEAPAAEPPRHQSSSYREALLEADQRGQYVAEVSVNGSPVRMLIDTGNPGLHLRFDRQAPGAEPVGRAHAPYSDGKRPIDRFPDEIEEPEPRRPLYERRRGSDSCARGGGSESARGKFSQAPGQRRATQRRVGAAPVDGFKRRE